MTLSPSRGQNEMPMLTDRNTSCWLMWKAAQAASSTVRASCTHLLAAFVAVGREAVDEQRELVAGQAAQHRFRRQHPREPLGQHFQHAVAGGMAEGVVDLLELVHVDVQQRQAEPGAPRARDRLLQQVLELHAVRDLGQRIVARQVADAALGALALGDVARDVHLAGEVGVVGGDAGGHEGHGDGLAGARAQHRLAGLARGRQRLGAGARLRLQQVADIACRSGRCRRSR